MVMNDKGYGVIKRIQDSLQGGRRFFADLQGPDLGQLAGLAGIPFFKVTSGEKFGETVAGLRIPELDREVFGRRGENGLAGVPCHHRDGGIVASELFL